jgi:ribosome biogenesis GTPase
MITLEDLGYNDRLEKYKADHKLHSFDTGRVISEHKERYVVKTPTNEFDAELLGNLRFTADSRSDLPAVGDWVALSEYDEGKALIHAIYPRHSLIERQAVGKTGQKQIIATNIDYGIIVQSINRDFNLNRLERYITLCNASNIKSIIILSKIDLIEEEELKTLLKQISDRIKDIPIIPLSNQSHIGLGNLTSYIKPGKTYCLLGSSGVGKSTLLNNLSGKKLMNTGKISQSIDRGKHITSHRELVVLNKGGILIDNPGMREVGIADNTGGIEITFDTLTKLAQKCKFHDCTHINEKGCALLEALENGDIDKESYTNYQKMERERAHFESSVKEKKNKDKNFGKMIKNVKKQRKNNKY